MKQFNCSFCGKHTKEVSAMINGPEVHICNECIDMCNDIINEKSENTKSISEITSNMIKDKPKHKLVSISKYSDLCLKQYQKLNTAEQNTIASKHKHWNTVHDNKFNIKKALINLLETYAPSTVREQIDLLTGETYVVKRKQRRKRAA